jgi:hypothetical protein
VVFRCIRLVIGEGVEQLGLGRCGIMCLALEPVSHAIIEQCIEGAVVDAVANSEIVLDGLGLVLGSLWRLRRRLDLLVS